MNDPRVEPWIPPSQPDLARLAMAVADEFEVRDLRAWPEARKGGIGFGALPPFLSWLGMLQGERHLVLLQAREVGALVPGARTAALPPGWLESLDLESMARPLAHHPAFSGCASIHVCHLEPTGVVQVRTYGTAAPAVVRAVLERLSDVRVWNFAD